jgi:hypothetical protein
MFAHYIFFLRTTLYTDFNVYTQQRLKRGQKSACFVQPVVDANSQDSSVSTVLNATIRISNPSRKKWFSILIHVYTGPGPYPATYSAGTGFYPGNKTAGAKCRPLNSLYRWDLEWVELYLCSAYVVAWRG